MAKKPTIGDILKSAKKESDKLRKKSVSKVRKVTDRLPIKGPIGLGVDIAEFASLVSQEIVNQAADIAFRDFQNVELPGKPVTRISKTILPKTDQIAETVVKVKRPRTEKQLINDQIMRTAMKNANTRARKQNGQLKKGMTQKKIARIAQRECTAERKRLGLCDDDMKKRSTRKGQVRKTARRAYEK